MIWDEYYERFFDWAESTQVSRLSSLTTFGDSSEVAEIAAELPDEKAATRLIRKALAYGVKFTAQEIVDLSDYVDDAGINELMETAQCRFTSEQLETLYGIVDDDILERVARKNKITLFEDEVCNEPLDDHAEPLPKIGFFSKLFMAIGAAEALTSPKQKAHSGHCNGDCAHCPPHYGYRYGRWYYGHSHAYGCEFGGNHGDGRD